MPNSLQPLAALGSGPVNQTPGMSPQQLEAVRQRQVMADALVADAKSPTGGGGSLFGAIGQGLKGYAGASMQQQNAADLARYAQSSPLAAGAFGGGQSAPGGAFSGLFSGLGSIFGGGSGPSASQPGFLTPDPDNRAGASLSTTPVVGTGLPWDDRDA